MPIDELSEFEKTQVQHRTRDIEIIFVMYSEGKTIETIGRTLRLGESYVEHVLKIGKEKAIEEIKPKAAPKK